VFAASSAITAVSQTPIPSDDKALSRIRQLADAKAVPRRVVEEAESQASVAAAKVHSTEAEVTKARAVLKARELKVKEAEVELKSRK
jgi:hypothetical protein